MVKQDEGREGTTVGKGHEIYFWYKKGYLLYSRLLEKMSDTKNYLRSSKSFAYE